MQLVAGILALSVAVLTPLCAARIVLNGIVALLAERQERHSQAQQLRADPSATT